MAWEQRDPAALPAPSAVTVESAPRRLTVDWEDGHQSRYPWWLLRGFCPCAGCQGHGQAFAFRPEIAGDEALGDVQEVGHYALNLAWGDGHNTGIYPFELLRRLCMCAGCRQGPPTRALWDQLGAAAQARWSGEVAA